MKKFSYALLMTVSFFFSHPVLACSIPGDFQYVAPDWLKQADWVIAPGLFHSELGNTLWKTVRFGSLSQDAAVDL